MPSNLWVGVSSPPDWMLGRRLTRRQQEAMLRKSLDVLRQVRERTGNLVWMSAEPVSWDLTAVIDERHPLNWIVIGAASNGPRYYPPDPGHVARLLAIMDATATPTFSKGNIGPLFVDHDLGSPALNRWLEEFPSRYRSGEPIAAVVRRQERCQQYGWTPSRYY